MQPATLLTSINAQQGTTFALVESYSGGESASGAYSVIDATGRRGVLKWDPGPEPATGDDLLRRVGATTARLRERGYPAPQYFLIGHTSAVCYSIQEMLPGTPLHVVTPAVLPRLLELNAM
jgi:hypothetical protein